MMTAREREKGNRQCVAAALVMLVGAFQCGWCAADLASWRAVGFALCGLGSAVALGVSALLFWVATSSWTVGVWRCPRNDRAKQTIKKRIEGEPMIVPSAERLQEGLFNIYSQALAPLPWTYERSQRIEGEYLRLKDALTLLDTLSQEVERLTNENQMLLTRVDSQRLSETTGSTALEKGR